MKTRPWLYRLSAVALCALLVSGVWFYTELVRWQQTTASPPPFRVSARALPAAPKQTAPGAIPRPQLVVGMPTDQTIPTNPRYTYRNEFPADRTKWPPLYLIDTKTGQETRLGDDSWPAIFGVMDDHYLVWYFAANVHAYNLVNGQDTLIAKLGDSGIRPQLFGDWLAFGRNNWDSAGFGTLFAANLQTREVFTLTHSLYTRTSLVNGYFGISDRLAAWYESGNTIVIYDLIAHTELTRLTPINAVFGQEYLEVYGILPGETVVTWNNKYGYDLITHAYFRFWQIDLPDWDKAAVRDISRLQERSRILFWTYKMRNSSQRAIPRTPIFAAPAASTPCREGHNLVRNGDLEDLAAYTVWEQSASANDLISNDLPPHSPQAGQWAIHLGQSSNRQQTIQQLLNLPANVKHLTLTFDVRASSWDIWGGDRLQVDLVDPITNQSVLATPVQWTNRQLANGGWMPLQVDIQDWLGSNTPLYLVFRAQTDWAFPTDFTLDNIRLLTGCH